MMKQPHHILTACWIAVIILLSAVGLWQQRVYMEKKATIALFNHRKDDRPVPIETALMLKDPQFIPIEIKGKYLPETSFVLLNQFNDDRAGFDILTPFYIPKVNRLILVDRGWVPSNEENKQFLEKILFSQKREMISGWLTRPIQAPLFGNVILKDMFFPIHISFVNIHILQRLFKLQLYPYVLHLHQKMPNRFQHVSPVSHLKPKVNYRFAMQCFAVAFVLLLSMIMIAFYEPSERKPRKTKTDSLFKRDKY